MDAPEDKQVEKATRDIAGVIAPPPLIYLAFLVIGLVSSRLWPLAAFGDSVPGSVRIPLGALLVAAGLAAAVTGFRQFRAAGTEVNPHRPTTALVSGGLYRFSRNPLYLALTSIYAGIASAADSLWALLLLVPALIVMRYGVIAREEAYLERKFGEAYRHYKQAVRRWL